MNKILKLSIMFFVAVAVFFTFGSTVNAKSGKTWITKTCFKKMTDYDKIPLESVIDIEIGDIFEVKSMDAMQLQRGTVLEIFPSSPPYWITVKWWGLEGDNIAGTVNLHPYLFPIGSEIRSIDIIPFEDSIIGLISGESVDFSNIESSILLLSLSAPPSDPNPGDRYINTTSMAECSYTCEKWLGNVECYWTAAYGIFTGSAYLGDGKIPCKAATLESDQLTITFPDKAIENRVIEKVGGAYPEKEQNGFNVVCSNSWASVTAYIVNVSGTGISAARLLTGNGIWSGYSIRANGEPIPLQLDINEKELSLNVGNPYRSGYYDSDGKLIITEEGIRYNLNGKITDFDTLPPGLYGIVFEMIDADHNRKISEVAPVKIRIN